MLEWNVYIENINKKEIEKYNIFNHGNFFSTIKDLKKNYLEKDEFLNELQFSLKYYFWCKCEWEIVLSDWPPSKKFKNKKISVYDQIMMNWEIFSTYVWENI